MLLLSPPAALDWHCKFLSEGVWVFFFFTFLIAKYSTLDYTSLSAPAPLPPPHKVMQVICLSSTFVSSSAIPCADGRPSLVPHWYFQSWGWLNGGKLLCSNSSLSGPGPYTSSLSSIDMLGLPFYNSYWMLRVHGRAIMNYQLNHGRFTDDWSICVTRTSTERERGREKIWNISLAWKFCSTILRNKARLIIWIEWTFLQIGSHIQGWISRHISLVLIFFPLLTHQYSFVSTLPLSLQHTSLLISKQCTRYISVWHCVRICCFNNTKELKSSELWENMKLKWARVTWISRISISLWGNEIQYHPW